VDAGLEDAAAEAEMEEAWPGVGCVRQYGVDCPFVDAAAKFGICL